MKCIFSIFLSFILTASVYAGSINDKITIGSNAKTSKLEIKYNSNYKKNLQANVIILDAEGNEVEAFICKIFKGANAVCMQDALNLKEGIYTVALTVKNKTFTTKFVLFK